MYHNKEYLYNEYIRKNRTEQSIADECGISVKLLHYYIQKFSLTHIKSRRKYTLNESKFTLLDPVFCYYAGLVITDGYIDYKNHRVSLRLKNDGSFEMLSALKQYFEFSGEIKQYGGCFDLTMTSDVLLTKMSMFGAKEPNKTYTLRFPKLLSKNEDCKRMFLRGILDGDGNIHTHKSKYTGKIVGGQFRIVTASEAFIAGLVRFINKQFNFNYTVGKAIVKDVVYPKLEMRTADSLTMYDWIYNGFDNFRLRDKYLKYQQLKVKI